MSSLSISSANTSGVHLNVNRTWSSPSTANIFALTLKHRASPHCSFSVASGNDRQYLRISSTFMSDSLQNETTLARINVGLVAYPARPAASKYWSVFLIYFRPTEGSHSHGHSRRRAPASGFRHAHRHSFLPRRAGLHHLGIVRAGGQLQLVRPAIE